MKRKLTIGFLLLIIMIGSGGIVNSNEATVDKKILINIPSRTLTYLEKEAINKVYPVAVGKPSSKTPQGIYSVLNKLVNPYYSRKNIPGGSPNNPLGIRWIGFKPSYGIHGNSAPNSIGTAASGGCVRMYNYDVKELYNKVEKNTKVEITYNIFDWANSAKGQEQILIIYPDIYKQEKKLNETIKSRLQEKGLGEKIAEDRIRAAVERSKEKITVLGTNWVLIINNHFIHTDIYPGESGIYIGEDILKQYFGFEMEEATEGTIMINNKQLGYSIIEGKKYVLLKHIQDALGGNIEVSDKVQNAWYNVSFIKLNNVFFDLNHSDLVTHKPLIPVERLIDTLGKEISSKEKVTQIKGKRYMDIEEAQSYFGFTYNLNSIDKRIELTVPLTIEIDGYPATYYTIGEKIFVRPPDISIISNSAAENFIELSKLEETHHVSVDRYRTKMVLRKKDSSEKMPSTANTAEQMMEGNGK